MTPESAGNPSNGGSKLLNPSAAAAFSQAVAAMQSLRSMQQARTSLLVNAAAQAQHHPHSQLLASQFLQNSAPALLNNSMGHAGGACHPKIGQGQNGQDIDLTLPITSTYLRRMRAIGLAAGLDQSFKMSHSVRNSFLYSISQKGLFKYSFLIIIFPKNTRNIHSSYLNVKNDTFKLIFNHCDIVQFSIMQKDKQSCVIIKLKIRLGICAYANLHLYLPQENICYSRNLVCRLKASKGRQHQQARVKPLKDALGKHLPFVLLFALLHKTSVSD